MIRAIGLPELLRILVIVFVFFGVGRISKIAGELGSGIRAFREGIQGSDDKGEKEQEEKTEAESESKNK